MVDPKGFLALVECAWRDRARAPGGQPLTRLHVHIAAKLAFWRSANPKHRSLARAARCSTRTVRRALARLAALGLLSWTRRVVCCRGWRAQVANSYSVGASPSLSPCLPIRISCSASLSPPGSQAPAEQSIAAARAALAAVSRAGEARMLAVWSARRAGR